MHGVVGVLSLVLKSLLPSLAWRGGTACNQFTANLRGNLDSQVGVALAGSVCMRVVLTGHLLID